jgi:hypothetical protein
MAQDDPDRGDAASRRKPFSFFAARGRIYARNVDQKVIDLGEISRDEAGVRYLLDGNGMSGRGLRDEKTALGDMAGKLRFLWLDGQFTAVADARDNPDLDLDGATQVDVTLDELPPGERMFDATV